MHKKQTLAYKLWCHLMELGELSEPRASVLQRGWMLASSLRPLPDFISQPWRKIGCEIKSGSGLGTRLGECSDSHTHTQAQCSHASVGLAQARPNYWSMPGKRFVPVWSHYLYVYIAVCQQFENAPIFLFVTYNSDGLSPFPSYLKQVLLPYVKSGSRLLPLFTTLPAFPVGNVSRKVWSTTQQTGVYPKARLFTV